MALQIDIPFALFVGVDLDGMAFVAPMNSYGEFAIKGDFHFWIIFDVPFHFRYPLYVIACFSFSLLSDKIITLEAINVKRFSIYFEKKYLTS